MTGIEDGAALVFNRRHPGEAGAGSFAGPTDELARAIDAYERLGIDDLIVRLQPSTQPALDRLARAIQIRGH